jgi:hypothetical protein
MTADVYLKFHGKRTFKQEVNGFYQYIGIKFEKETSSVLHLELAIALYGAETWTLSKVDQKYVKSFEMWCWRRMEKISWTDSVRNERKGGDEYLTDSGKKVGKLYGTRLA